MTLHEEICRAICIAEGVNPDQEGCGLGNLMPLGEVYPLWKARSKVADLLISNFDIKKTVKIVESLQAANDNAA